MNEELDIEKIRNIIAGDVVAHIYECFKEKIVQYLVIRTFPGSGKTTSAMQAIDKAGYNWIYLAPFHEVIKENLLYSKVRDYDFIHLKGKQQQGVCVAEKYRKYAKMGISIDPFCEGKCPYRHNGCPYYKTRDLIESYPESWAGVHSHVPTYLQKFLYQINYNDKQMFKHYDVIIIDEFPFQVLFNQVIVQRKDIDELRVVINHMENTPERELIMKILNELTLASVGIDIKHVKIKSIIDNTRGLEFNEFIKEYDRELLWMITNESIKRPPKNILFNLVLIYDLNPELEKLEWMLYKKDKNDWMKSGIYITTSNIHYFKNLPIPVVALDATAEIDAWNTLLNDNCLYETIDMEYKNTYQMHSYAHYPSTSWMLINEGKIELSKTGERLAKLTIEICKRTKQKVLICSTKKVKKLLKKYLEENYKRTNYIFANYYNLRSRNSFYEECDTCIITHEPNIPQLQLEIMHNVTGWDMNLLKELMTKSEIKQAIGRIRQNIKETPYGRKRKKVEVYIFPGVEKDEDKLVPKAKLIPYRKMFVGEIESLSKVLEKIIKAVKKTNLSSLKKLIPYVSKRVLRDELVLLYKNDKISNYKRNIEWIYDEKKHNKTKYNRIRS